VHVSVCSNPQLFIVESQSLSNEAVFQPPYWPTRAIDLRNGDRARNTINDAAVLAAIPATEEC
jgi:hypothetical protein